MHFLKVAELRRLINSSVGDTKLESIITLDKTHATIDLTGELEIYNFN